MGLVALVGLGPDGPTDPAGPAVAEEAPLTSTESSDGEAPEQRKAIAELAERCFDTKSIKRLRTKRFTILTNLPSDENLRLFGSNLDSTFDVLDTVFGKPAPANSEPIAVYVYREAWQFNRLARSGTVAPHTVGIYMRALPLLAFHADLPSNQALAMVMIHEATHAYLDRQVRPAGVEFPRWFNEGVAEYVGNSAIRDGKLVLGSFRRTEHTEHGYLRSQPYVRLEDLRLSFRGKDRLSLVELLSADSATFRDDPHIHYAASWMLVHFLRHTSDPRVQGRFPKLVDALCRGTASVDAVREVYGDVAQLEAVYRRYVRRGAEE